MDFQDENQWRVVCAGMHAGPPHIYERYNRAAAEDMLEHFSQAQLPFTKEFCLPATIETRFVSAWVRVA